MIAVRLTRLVSGRATPLGSLLPERPGYVLSWNVVVSTSTTARRHVAPHPMENSGSRGITLLLRGNSMSCAGQNETRAVADQRSHPPRFVAENLSRSKTAARTFCERRRKRKRFSPPTSGPAARADAAVVPVQREGTAHLTFPGMGLLDFWMDHSFSTSFIMLERTAPTALLSAVAKLVVPSRRFRGRHSASARQLCFPVTRASS